MIIFGRHCVEQVLNLAPQKIQSIFVAKDIPPKLFGRLSRLGVKIERVDNKKAQALARGGNHQGLLARINDLELASREDALKVDSMIVLCGLSDVGNIGAIARSAYALGVEAMLLCDRASLSMPALEGIFRTSSGALLGLPFCLAGQSLDLVNQLKQLDCITIGAASRPKIESKNEETKTPKKWALFIGHEELGLAPRLQRKLDRIAAISMAHDFDSLNASVAAGILIDRIRTGRF